MESLSNPVEIIRQSSIDDARERRVLSTDVWIPKDGDLFHEHLDELEMIFRHSRSAELPKIIIFAMETAMHRSGIADLQSANVNIHKRFALLPMTKNGSSRVVPLSSKAVEIWKILTERDDGRCFKYRPTQSPKHLQMLLATHATPTQERQSLHLKKKHPGENRQAHQR